MSASVGLTRGPRRMLRKVGSAVLSGAVASALILGTDLGRSTTAVADAAIPPAGVYSITDLGTNGGYAAFALNDYGDVVGGMSSGVSGGNGFLYSGELSATPGTVTDLGPGAALAVDDAGAAYGPGHGTGAGGTALAVTPDGKTAAGVAFRSGLTWPSYAWPNGSPGIWSRSAGWRNLYDSGCTLPGLFSAAASAINSSGTLVGQGVRDDDGNTANGGSAGVAFKCTPSLVNPGTYTAYNLASWGGPFAGAFAVNRRGTIAGKAQVGGGPIEAIVWDGVLPESLGTSAEGHSPPAGSVSQSAAYGINDAGDVVGTYGPTATSPTLQVGSRANRAFRWSAGAGMEDLTEMLPAGSPWTLTAAFDINNRGQIVGQGLFNGELRAFLLTPRGDVNISAQNIVVTQAVQNERNLDLLVAGKQTYAIVRAFSDTRDVPGVTAVLRGRSGLSELGELRPVSPRVTVRRRANGDLAITEQSFVFALPESWSQAGSLSLEAEVNHDFRVEETRYTDNRATATVRFGNSLPLKMVVINAYYEGRPRPAVNTVALEKLRQSITQLFPTSEITITQTETMTPITEPRARADGDDKCAGVLKELERIRTRMHIDRRTLLYGLMPPNADGTGPYGFRNQRGVLVDAGVLGCSFTPSMVLTGSTVPGAEMTGAHELIHALGRQHIPFCGAEGSDADGYPGGSALIFYGSLHQNVFPLPSGFDLGFDGTRIVSKSNADIMSYCRPRWVSDYTYENVYRLIPRVGGAPVGIGDLAGDVVSVVGTINLVDGTADVSATYGPVESEPTAPSPGPYHIEFYDGATKLSDIGFTPAPAIGEGGVGSEASHALVSETVNLPPGADRMAIYDDQAGREISSTPIVGSAPTVTATSPDTGEQLPSSGDVTVQWSSSDVDGDALTYTVLYRPAADAPWAVLASGIDASSLTVDAAGLAGSTNGTIRVVAHDGFFTGSDEVTGLRVPGKPPVVTIDAPADGSVSTVEQSVLLTGYAQTVGAVDLPDSAFVWSSDRDGTLGTGPAVLAGSLTVGVHEVTLRVTDLDGRVGEATVTIDVRAAGGTPSMLAVSFDELGFTGTPTSQPDPQGFEIYDPAGASLEWTATSDNPAVTLSAATGTTPAMVDVDVDTSGLLGGETLAAKVTVQRTGGSQEPLVVDVSAASSLPLADVSPGTIDFGLQARGTTGAPHIVTLTYNGRGQMTLGASALAGPAPDEYALSADQCAGATLSTGQSCTVAVSFRPTSAGRRPAYLVLADSESSAQWLVSLTGYGSRQIVQSDGTLLAWGKNDHGQAGFVPSTPPCWHCIPVPNTVPGITDVTDAAAGYLSSVAATSDGRAWTWGGNCAGTLGNGTRDCTVAYPTPQPVPGLTGVVDVAAGPEHSLALLQNGTVVGWGESLGAYGLGGGYITSPRRVCDPAIGACLGPAQDALSHVVEIAAGGPQTPIWPGRGASYALSSDGTVWQWGGWLCCYAQPVIGPDGAPLSDIVAIAHSLALRSDGSVWAWGDGSDGQLGNGTRPTPTSTLTAVTAVQVLNSAGTGPLTGVVAIASYDRERYALRSDGTVLAWGSGRTFIYGDTDAGIALGIGGSHPTGVDLPAPVLAPGGAAPLSGARDIAAGLAALGDGTVAAWGDSRFGGLGDGTYGSSPWTNDNRGPLAPVLVKGVGGQGLLTGVARLVGGLTRFALSAGGSTSTLTAGAPVSITTTAGDAFDEVIASFDDSAPSTQAFAFAASVDWGDGSADSATTVTGPDGGPFEIHGTHVYSRPGTYALTIDVIGRSGDSITLIGSASVANVTLGALPAHDANFTAGAPSQQSLAGFGDPNPTDAEASFTATVDWGDGTSGAAIVLGPPGGPFSVNGEHTYSRAGTYPLVLHVVEVDGAEITLPGNAIVAPASLTADATFSSDVESGQSFSGPVARFRDGNPLSSSSDYTAVIDWGDGSQTAGAVSGPTGGPYTVAGSHTYATTQPFTVTVTLTGPAGASASADTTLLLRLQQVSLTASAAPASGDVPLDAVFSYVVRNDGTDPLWAVGVDGSICGPAALSGSDDGNGVLDPGESWTFTCRHAFNEAGTFTDVSWASGYGLLDGLPVRSGNVSTEVSAGGTVNEAPLLTVPATASGQYSDPIATIGISATDVDNELTELRLSIDASKCTGGQRLPDNLELADNGDGTATITGRLNVVPGTYTPCVVVIDGDGGEDAEKITITVTWEDATIVDILPTFIQIDGNDGDIDSVALTGKFVEAADGYPSSTLSTYATAYGATDVKFDLSPIGSGSSGRNCTDTGVPTTGGSPVGCPVLNLLSDVYQIDADIQGAWFSGIGIGSLAVFDPANGFATGGGHFIWSDGPSPWTGAKANFGFTGKLVNKNVKGSVLLVIHTASGPYVIKTNAFSGLANQQVTGQGYWYTSMTGKATYSVPTGQVNPYCSPDSLKCGNFTVIMYAEDRAEPGAGVDTYKLKLIAPNSLVVFDMSLQTILGGNVQVPHK